MNGSRPISRIPQPTPKAAPSELPRYMRQTISSSLKVHTPTPERSKSRPTASVASVVPRTNHVAKERLGSKIPVLSKNRVNRSPLRDTPSASAQPPTQPASAPSSPPPQYTECSEASGELFSINIQPPYPSSPQALPRYLGHAPESESKIYVYPYSELKALLASTESGCHGKGPEPSQKCVDEWVARSCDGLDECPDELALEIHGDIFSAISSDSELVEVALSA